MADASMASDAGGQDAQAQLRLRNWELTERCKELACLHGISRLRERPDASLKSFLQETIKLIPPAWQFPALAVARIRVHDEIFTSGPFPSDPVTQSSPIKEGGQVIGSVEVGYRKGLPLDGADPFLEEERHLLDTIGEQISAAVAQSRAAGQITKYQAQLRSLASELALTGERERRQIAQELHDKIGHNLAAIKFRLNRMRAGVPGGPVDEVLEILDQTIRSSRNLTFELSPPVLHELGLGAALEWLVHQLRANYGIAGHYAGDHRPMPLSEDQRIALFQAVRELLTNVGKHSSASMARVETHRTSGGLSIVVADDGIGFNPTGSPSPSQGLDSMGLFSVRERLAHLGIGMEIDSGPGRGTRVMLQVPSHLLQEKRQGQGPGSADPAARPDAPQRPIRILLAEDQTLTREGLRSLLQPYPDLEVVAEAQDGESAVAACREYLPDVVVMDIAMPRLNGLEATRLILEERPSTKVIALSMHADGQYVLEMLRAGASGYLLKDCVQEDLAQAIRAVQAHLSFLSPGLTAHVAAEWAKGPGGKTLDQARLSPRERLVLTHLARGLCSKEIAAELKISPKTVETYRKHLMEKLGIDHVAGLTRLAIREGLVHLED